MEFINKGNFDLALKELKQDHNNAICSIFEKQNSTQGILSGVTFTLKNNYAKDFSFTNASSNILENFNPGYNATILDKLLTNGATLVATTNLDEFGLGGTGEYSNQGIILHPLNQQHLVGGSSSGCAATFTKNIGFSIGSDTGDSVRLPASNIGAVGFKPSYGAVSRYGLFSFASSMDTVAWFSHNINDTFIIAKTLYGHDDLDLTSVEIKLTQLETEKPGSVAFLDCFDLLEEYVSKKYQQIIDKLKKENIQVIRIKPDQDLLNAIKIVYYIISFSEASSNLSNLNGIAFGKREKGKDWEDILKNTRSKNLGNLVQKRLALGSYFLEKENQEKYFIKAQKVRRLIQDWFNKIYEKNDLLIFPCSPTIAPTIGQDLSKYQYMQYILTSSNLVGNPSISLKMGSFKNMPFNLALETKIYEDQKILNYASYFEKLLGEIND